MRINEFTIDPKIFDDMSIAKNKNKDVEQKSENSFFNTLKGKLDEVNEKQITAEKATESFIKGEEINVHNVMLDSEEAKMSIELAVQVRNKLVEAYQELNRMQL
ncbi:flagellar hook-basal body complex protein FliE [Clostridium tetanomorphum]|uniref:Flagellar hook-basal body complex protein FliE n=1 Tax=Clostridium tetanomorphum TaxID=1553 RepID=A0A923IZ73_CLOTT|nr:flagellar hook-basal body complex protein FliE [Clostridium tetanomorphum]KAJ49908.1 flagellar hook-basal body protein FliE [Clostridium tetanomorphum DSM 665]MBC2396687.1 flagellar hook-basal body complex protein FliE [Clostridium tetanomorphum]MBP1866154.1 flagellar hook-basal body complex protein FliE [Clostridium tetanomorphum]NRS85133.1 flagellar hook-basal body complex protein FliE [Clostridium tetanomorphum]NRZ98314.1 flagellar hook-basal body complex protein FliE [Clostridium tetano